MTLTLMIAEQFFSMTLCLMIKHRRTKCGYKKWSSSGDILQTKSRYMVRQT